MLTLLITKILDKTAPKVLIANWFLLNDFKALDKPCIFRAMLCDELPDLPADPVKTLKKPITSLIDCLITTKASFPALPIRLNVA